MTFGTKNIYVLCSSACVRAKTLNIKLTNVLVSAQVYLREEEKRLRKEDRTQQIIICAIGVVRRKYGSFLLGRILRYWFSLIRKTHDGHYLLSKSTIHYCLDLCKMIREIFAG